MPMAPDAERVALLRASSPDKEVVPPRGARFGLRLALLATGAYPNIGVAFRSILKEQGVSGFWSSNLANVVQVGRASLSFAELR